MFDTGRCQVVDRVYHYRSCSDNLSIVFIRIQIPHRSNDNRVGGSYDLEQLSNNASVSLVTSESLVKAIVSTSFQTPYHSNHHNTYASAVYIPSSCGHTRLTTAIPISYFSVRTCCCLQSFRAFLQRGIKTLQPMITQALQKQKSSASSERMLGETGNRTQNLLHSTEHGLKVWC